MPSTILTRMKEIKVSSLHHRMSRMKHRMPSKESSSGIGLGWRQIKITLPGGDTKRIPKKALPTLSGRDAPEKSPRRTGGNKTTKNKLSWGKINRVAFRR